MIGGGGFLAGSIIGKLGLDKTGWNSAVSEVKKDQTGLQTGASTTGGSFTKMGLVMGAAGAAILGGMTALALKTSEVAEQYVLLSGKTGISVEKLSAWKYAAEVADVPIETLAGGLRKMTMNMADAAAGGEKQKAAFDVMGVSATDVHGKLKPMDDLLMELADKFSVLPDGPAKSAAAMDIFGKSGANLLPFLNLGREGIGKLTDEAKKFGLVMGTEAAMAADNFGDQMTALKMGMQGAFQQLALTLMPTLTSFVEKVKEIVMHVNTWVQQHPGLTKAIGLGALAVGGLMAVLGPMLLILPQLVKGFQLLKTGIQGASLSKMASIAAWGAVIALAARYAGILMELRDAHEYEKTAGDRLAEVQSRLKDKLWDAARAAGMSKTAFEELTAKYHGNIAAMGMAIEKGKETKSLQESLTEVGKKHAAAIEEQRKKLEEAQAAVEKKKIAEEAAKKVSEEWISFLKDAGIVTAATSVETDKYAGYIRELDRLLKAGKISHEDYAKGVHAVNSALEPFSRYVAGGSVAMATATGKGRDLYSLMKSMPKEIGSTGYAFGTLDDKLDAVAYGMGISTTTLKAYIYELQRLQLQILGIHLPPFPGWPKDEIKTAVVDPVSEAFAGLYNNIAQGFGNTFQSFVETWSVSKLLKMDIDFKEFFKGLWGNIKDSFFTMVGELATKWIKGFLEEALLKKTAEAATSAGSSIAGVGTSVTSLATTVTSVAGAIGTVITTLAAAIGTAIGSIAVGLATAIVTLATAVASAATILAAAAPALLIVGGIALALYAGFSLITKLLGGGGGKQTDVTYWLKMMHADGKELHDFTLNLPEAYFNAWWNFFDGTNWATRETVTVLYAIKDFFGPMLSALESIDSQISKLAHGASGMVLNEPTLMVAGEGGPAVPEALIPIPNLKAALEEAGARGAGGGGGGQTVVSMVANFYIQCLDSEDMREVVRTKIGPEFIETIRGNLLKRDLQEALGV